MLSQDVSTDFCIAEDGGLEVVAHPCKQFTQFDQFGVLAHPVERSYGIAEVASSSLAHSTITSDKNSLETVRFFVLSQFRNEAGFFL